MKKIQNFNPFIITVILLLLITSCKKTGNEELPVKSAPILTTYDASSVKGAGIIPVSSTAKPQLNALAIMIPLTEGPPSATTPSVTISNSISIGNNITVGRFSGAVNANNLPTTVTFEYGFDGLGTTKVYNMSLPANPNLVTGYINNNVNGISQSLKANSIYHVRIKAENSLGAVYSSSSLFTTIKIVLGQSTGGGIVFYVDDSGRHGLIATPADQGVHQWSTPQSLFNAGSICNQLIINGYGNWFLPSKSQLSLMYRNLKVAGLGKFSEGVYWSSSEMGNSNAVAQNFSNGSHANPLKSLAYMVRAIRVF